MKVVLDTNIIFNDPYLKGAKIKGLCESVKSTGDSVYIPAIVIDESINKHREKIQECKSKIDKDISELTRFIGKKIKDNLISEEFILKEIDEYAIIFREQLRKLDIKIIPYPSISHEELVKRDLARKRPFQPSGKGYRDALIWENIKGICKKTSSLFEMPHIIFVTQNHTDFCKDGLIHPDLKDNLRNNGINEDYVEVVDSIDIFTNKYIKSKQDFLRNILSELNVKKQYNEIDLNAEIEDRAINFLLYREFDYEESPFGQGFESPTIVSIDDVSFKVTDVRQISEAEILIELSVEVECEFNFFIFKSDVLCMDEDELPHILDSDWNKHYMAASQAVPIKLKVSLIVNTAFSEILSDDMEIIHPEIDV